MAADAEVELYWFDCEPREGVVGRLRQPLGKEELARADRFQFPEHRRRFIGAHAGLRAILARKLGVGAAAVRFEIGTNGKPYLAGLPLQFNLSHSGRYALVGVSEAGEIGVDIETERAGVETLGLARRFFTAEETAWLEALPAGERRRGFFRLWTCKEAWLKVDGQGMALPLDRVQVTFAAEGTTLRTAKPPHRAWFVREFDLVAGVCAAVVMAAAPETIRIEAWDLAELH